MNRFIRAAHRKTAIAMGTLATLSIATPALGASADPRSMLGTVGTQSGMSTTELPTMIGTFIKQIITLLGIVLVVLIIYAGFKWMLARDNEDDVKEAKEIIKNSVIGLVLLLAAYSITEFVLGAILEGTGTAT